MNAIAPARQGDVALETRRLQALAAIIAGPLFLAVVATLTLIELDFMHELGWGFTSDDQVPWPSGLALGDYGAVQVLDFAIVAALLGFFAHGFRRELPASKRGRAAALAIAAIPFAFAVSAFPTDRATVASQEPNTWHGWLHVIGFVVLALASIIAPLLTAVALRGNARWPGFAALSISVVVLEIVFFVPLDFLGDSAFVGYLIVLFGWFALLGVRFRRLASAEER